MPDPTTEFPDGSAGAQELVTHVLRAGAEERFDRLTRLTASTLRCSAAVLALMDDARLFVKSGHGLPEPWASRPRVPLPHAMVRHALASPSAFTVEDVRQHALTRDMRLAAGWERAAYCGVPILLEDGTVVGVFAALERKPRAWSEREVAFLKGLAGTAAQELRRVPRRAPAEPPRTEPPRAPEPSTPPVHDPETDFGLQLEDAVEDWAFELDDRISAPDELPWLELGEGLEEESPPPPPPAGEPEVPPPAEVVEPEVVQPARIVPVAPRDAEEAKYRRLFETSTDAIFFLDPQGFFTECNDAALNFFGYELCELNEQRLQDLFVDDEERARLERELLSAGEVLGMEAQLRTKEGSLLECQLSVGSRRAGDGTVQGYHGVVHDVTMQKRVHSELMHNAFHDALTSLPNRALFVDRLERVLLIANRRPDYRFAVLFVDLDRFKLVNDTLGHRAGDELLQAVARRLEMCVRQEDSVARFGGDEFAILLDAINDVSDATRVADRILHELSLPFQIGRREVICSASIGITLSVTGYESGVEVLHDADTAMYRAKSSGRGRYEIFDTEMHTRALSQLQLESDLRRAVQQGQFVVHYQPVISIDGGAITGFEALVRWNHPQRGILLPREWMTVADQTGLMVDIGYFVLAAACRQMRTWEQHFRDTAIQLYVGVNLSARQFRDPDLVRRLDEILGDTGLDAHRLRLEMTETVVMHNPDMSASVLEQLRSRGVQICIDDFGTGFSSLSRLQRFPISMLKIDRSFISDVDANAENRGVVQAIIALGRSLSAEAVAEGVETLEQLQELRSLGTRYAQGFLFSQPLDSAAASELVMDRAKD